MWDSKRDKDVKNRLLDSMGEGEGGMIWENSIETCILSYVKMKPASPGLMHETECSGLVYWDVPGGWDGEGSGREGQDGEHLYTYGWFMGEWQKPPQYCKVISLQLKEKKTCQIILVLAELFNSFPSQTETPPPKVLKWSKGLVWCVLPPTSLIQFPTGFSLFYPNHINLAAVQWTCWAQSYLKISAPCA